jgi:hypothetical protein
MRHVYLVLLLCGMVACGGLVVTVARAHGAAQQRTASGQRLFKGEDPLAARINGISNVLEPEASRCSNCHEGVNPPDAAKEASSGWVPAAPILTPLLLTQEVSRRGGPPSRFNQESFCRLLTTGVDPAYVLVPRTMPRYEVTPSQCEDLWRYLIE